jgi:mRNA interferase MazF
MSDTMAITSQLQPAGFPLTLELKSGNLPKQSWLKISQIRTLSVERIGKRIGKISPEELVQVIDGLNEIIGI